MKIYMVNGQPASIEEYDQALAVWLERAAVGQITEISLEVKEEL